MTKVICFDLDGVLLEKTHTSLVELLSKRLRKDKDFLKDVLFVRASEEGGYDDYKKGMIDEEYWEWLLNALETEGTFTKEDYLDVLSESQSINKDAVQLIDKLRAKGIKTAICSNNYKANIERMKDRFGLDKFFDIQVFSFEVGEMKPHPSTFKELIRKSDCNPSEILYFDDKEENVEAARDAGIDAHLYTGFDDFKERVGRLI